MALTWHFSLTTTETSLPDTSRFPRMKLWLLAVTFFATLVWCFTPQEIETFQLQHDLVKKYGSEMNLYKFLKLKKGKQSTSREIIKNLRQLSKKYHPDKNKKYRKLYERLNLATNILSNDERRKNYDYYLKNGFPDYDFSKGGYFFTRVQPKTYVILLFVYIAISVIHYGVLRLQYTSNRRRIEDFIAQCKEADDTDGLGEKRLAFQQHSEDEPKELLIKFGDVFLLEPNPNGDVDKPIRTLISPDTVENPTIMDCMFFRLPIWLFNKFTRQPKIVTKDSKQSTKAKRNLKPKNQ